MLKVLLFTALCCFSIISQAAPRYSDPDGCFSCHELEGLTFVGEQGVTRVATIDKSHYFSSLHGSVPCKDCHRKIVDYPHKVENGYADCTESCHVEEPSDGVAYTHKPIHEEMEKSVHHDGWFKDFAGGNRLEEIETEQDPSCRRCHSNTSYIMPSQLENFKEAFDHAETECGTCHQGKAWMGQFGGHILRRFVGSRWVKTENNQMCMDCHADLEKMRDVELIDYETEEKGPPSERFVHASNTYDKTLHGRLLIAGSEYGASCIDCHAYENWNHEIRHYRDPKSNSHIDNLPETCGQSDCHGYAKKPGNEGFVKTDMHDVSMLNLTKVVDRLTNKVLHQSAWFWSGGVLVILGVGLIAGSLIWFLFYRHDKKIIPYFGGDRFERVMIGRKQRKKAGKAAPNKATRAKPRAAAKPQTTDSKDDGQVQEKAQQEEKTAMNSDKNQPEEKK